MLTEDELSWILDDALDHAAGYFGHAEIRTAAQAERALAHLSDIHAEQENATRVADARRRAVNEWEAEALARLAKHENEIHAKLSAYLGVNDLKSVNTPAGKAALRGQPALWHWPGNGPEDAERRDAHLKWAVGQKLVRATAKAAGQSAVDLAGIAATEGYALSLEEQRVEIKAACAVVGGRAVVKDTGEVVPGVIVEDDRPPVLVVVLPKK